jgi:hypothetical protein
MDNHNQKPGEELNQLSRLVFGRAAKFWYCAIAIEFFAGLLGVMASIVRLPSDWQLVFAICGFGLFALAYYFKIVFDRLYDDAETMRRQSVLTEALDWPISKTQFSEWRLKAGKGILDSFELEQRDPDYYETREKTGPGRLRDMTIESAFYTRHLYAKATKVLWWLFAVVVIGIVTAVSFSSLKSLPQSSSFNVVYAVYLLLPVILSIDLLEWGIKLNARMGSICEIERDLERLEADGGVDLTQVMRLVSEYNCQVADGFPIPDWFFSRHHNEIKRLWDKRG